MLEQKLTLSMLLRQVSDEACLGEVLFFPEFSRLGANAAQVMTTLAADVAQWLNDIDSEGRLELYQRWLAGETHPVECRVTIEAPAKSVAWRDPVDLVFYGVAWLQRDGSAAAYFPDLEIEVLADSEDALAQQCEQEVAGALQRTRKTRSLSRLAMTQQTTQLTARQRPMKTQWHSLKRTVRMEEQASGADKTVLDEVAQRLREPWRLQKAFQYEFLVQQLVDQLAARRPTSALLVGPSGVGKTAMVHELVRIQDSTPLAHRPIWTTDGSRLISGMMGFGMWQQRCQDLCRECSSQNAILHVGSLVELMEVGKSEGQSQGVASFLRPFVARGDLLMVAEATPEEVAFIERTAPQLLGVFQRIEIAQPAADVELRILRRALDDLERGGDGLMENDALEQLAALHRRYATYSASPGRPLEFLRSMVADHKSHREGDETLSVADVTASFSRATGLPLSMLEPTIPLDHEETRNWFTSRVIGQDAAVDAVVDVLFRLKASLNRGSRPLASLLFVGPTGVGKTELAKNLARFLFGSAQRLIRIDMSEYADGLAVQRLIGGLNQAEGVLTARVREQPFSVVLLDEFEKAHPLFFDLLLQVLGDGRLTDGRGRLADFRNCVVIMTSNLGTKDFAKQGLGFEGRATSQDVVSHFRRAVESFLRPELYNRMDHVAPFQPLSGETATKIIQRELDLLRHRDGLRFRPVALDVAPDVVDYLRRQGFEPQYGARSLKRVMERLVVIPLARELNRFSIDRAVLARVKLVEGEIRLNVDSQDHTAKEIGRRSEYRLLTRAQELRRYWQALTQCSALEELRSRRYRLERRQRKLIRKRHLTEKDVKELEEHRLIDAQIVRIEEAGEGMLAYENEQLLSLIQREQASDAAADSQWERVAAWEFEMCDLAMELHAATTPGSDKVGMFVYGGSRRALAQLGQLYMHVAQSLGGSAEVWSYSQADASESERECDEQQWSLETLDWIEQAPRRADAADYDRAFWLGVEVRPREKQLWRKRVRQPEAFFAAGEVPRGALGLYVSLTGDMVRPRLCAETGRHEFSIKEQTARAVVLAEVDPVKRFLPGWRFHRESYLAYGVRREYREKAIVDRVLKDRFVVKRGEVLETAAELILMEHRRQAIGVAHQ